jgi:hypothetical protein
MQMAREFLNKHTKDKAILSIKTNMQPETIKNDLDILDTLKALKADRPNKVYFWIWYGPAS